MRFWTQIFWDILTILSLSEFSVASILSYPKIGCLQLPLFVAVCLTNCGKAVYIQFLKTLCRLDKDIILGRIMYDMKMYYTYCVVLMWNDTLYSDVQWEFLKWCTAFGHTVWIFEKNTMLGRIVWFFERILYSDV